MLRKIVISIVLAFFCLSLGRAQSLIPIMGKALSEKSSVYYIDFSKYPRNMSQLPIGVFDSGTGGFTVLERIYDQDKFDNVTGEYKPDGIPDFINEDFEYLADQANMPYGNYPAEGKVGFLEELAVKDALFMLGNKYSIHAKDTALLGQKKPVKMIVIACNTATAYGLKHIENLIQIGNSSVQVIGVVNSGSLGALNTVSKFREVSMGILATPATISSQVYENTLRTLAQRSFPSLTLHLVSQSGYGFAESVDEEVDYVDKRLTSFSNNYRGPKLGTNEENIKPDLLDAYDFDESNGSLFIEYKQDTIPIRIQLNSSENYARFNLVSLLEKAKDKGLNTPIKVIILGCTHYPFALDILQSHLKYLKNFVDKKGERPYFSLIDDDCVFLDPATYVAEDCYKLLIQHKILTDKKQEGFLQSYISVPNGYLQKEYLDPDGNLNYSYKYGRLENTEALSTLVVPFSDASISKNNLQRIQKLLPICSQKLDSFMSTRGKDVESNSVLANKDENTPFTPWVIFIDCGIISILILIGKFIRIRFKVIQKYFVPPSLIAGFLGLAFGFNGLKWIPLSQHTGTYAGILIACVFSCLAFSSRFSSKESGNVGRMWFFSQTGMLCQWLFGILFGIVVLKFFWPNLSDSFGLSLPSGFCGGHGTAAAVGAAFSLYGNDEMLSLAMTSATVGILASVIVGIFIIKWATKKSYTSYLDDFTKLPMELKTGLIPTEKRISLGESTVSSISLDTLTLHFALVLSIAFGGYLCSEGVKLILPQLSLPIFSCAFIVGIAVVYMIKKTRINGIISTDIINHMSSSLTDVLVVCGIASIKLSVVFQYLVPLTLLMLSGLIVTFAYVFFVSRRIFGTNWFEKAIFTWGWYTGTMAMGIALLRVVDPDMRTHCLEEYALAYLFIAPVEIALVTFAPIAFVGGYAWIFILMMTLALGAIFIFAKLKGWLWK